VSEELSPIAIALLGGSDRPDKEVPCTRCRKLTLCPGFIYESVVQWNRQEDRLAQQMGRKSELIGSGEIIPCDSCAPVVRQERREQWMEENAKTDAYLKMLRGGNYNQESLAWLRRHGHGRDVDAYFSQIGVQQ
jgi:hypothetical protein